MTDLKNLVNEANSNLQDLKVLLHETQLWVQDHSNDGPACGEGEQKKLADSADGMEKKLSPQLQLEQACQRVSQALQQIEAAYDRNQLKLTQLEGELVVHLETLKQDAVEHFARGQYRECLGIVAFLCQLEPHNQMLSDYLEQSRQKLQLAEALDGSAASPSSGVEGQAGVESLQAESPQQGLSCPLEIEQFETGFEPNEGRSFLDQGQEGEPLPPSASQPELSSPIQQLPIKPELSRDSEQPVGTGQSISLNRWQLKRRSGVSVAVGAIVLFGLLAGLKYRQSRTSSAPSPSPAAVQVSLPQAPPSPLENLQETALSLFNQGRLWEAERNCDDLLAQDPQNAIALALKEKIQVSYLEQSRLTKSQSPSEQAPIAVPPAQEQSLGARSVAQSEVKPSTAPGPAADSVETDVQRLHQEIVQAFTSANYLPPAGGNALELIRRLERLAPSDDFGTAKRDQLYQELVAQVRQKLQAQQFEQARSQLELLQRYFPERGDLKELLGAVPSRQAPPPAPKHWVERAELALNAGHYVTPAEDNALLNCNRALALDPSNPKALHLKQQSINQAVGQARDWAHNGVFEEARQLYAALYYLSQNERDFPFSVQELRQELDKLEFRAYPVIHEHTLGSCTGRLRMNAYVISFVPSTDSRDGFSEKLSEISVGDPGPKLKIKVGNKNYRFQANLALDKEDNQERVKSIYEQLIGLVAKAR